ncbi:MAG: GNAT family N-acetyltransferase [Methanomassiliicoccales archaeon]|nr:MAG: GNAT family N-acetyltransferase [Methanomassiliicoccales archaeon]
MSSFSIRTMRPTDIEMARELARSVWGDQLYRDTGVALDYPARDRRVYEAYLDLEPEGNFVAESEGKVVAAAYAHSWGSVGWVGPLEVMPSHQGKGIGRALMERASFYLESSGCTTMGVETMGDSDRNIRFYTSLGYRLHSPTFVYEKQLGERDIFPHGVEVKTSLSEIEREGLRELSDAVFPEMDLSKEFRIATEMSIGRVLLIKDSDHRERILGAAIVHGRTVEGLTSHLLRALMVDPYHEERSSLFSRLIMSSEVVAKGMGAKKLFFTSSVTSASISVLASEGYRTIANNVRMLKKGPYYERGDLQLLSWAG